MENQIIKFKNRGRNMCFLNSVIQALWNLCSFKSFLDKIVTSHNHSTEIKYLDLILSILESILITEKSPNSNSDISSTYINLKTAIDITTCKRISMLNKDGEEKSLTNDEYKKKQENCVLCILMVNFTNFKFSENKTFDLMSIRKLLIQLNESIEKFNLKGVLLFFI
jgi:hypothetical protein